MAGFQAFAVTVLLATLCFPAATSTRSLFQESEAAAPVPEGIVAAPSTTPDSEDDITLAEDVQPAQRASESDTDQLNFALNLKYLMAEFYLCAAYGTPLPDYLRGGGPASNGCQKANLNSASEVVLELADTELKHVIALRRQLGDAAVPIPELNIGSAFTEAARYAFDPTPSTSFSPYTDDNSFYLAAFLLEEPVGFTYYEGLIEQVRDPSNLVLVAKILGVEASHSSLVRTFLYNARDEMTPYDRNVATATLDFALLRGTLGAGNGQGIEAEYNGTAGANLVADDPSGLSYSRVPVQVMSFVLFNQRNENGGGGFFPAGLNGAMADSMR